MPSLISLQRNVLEIVLAKIGDFLEQKVQAHKQAFKEEKLTNYFKATPYFCSKVVEAVVSEKPILYAVGLGGLDNVEQSLKSFEKALKRRNPAYLENLKHKYNLLEWAIQRVRLFLEARQRGEEADIPLAEAEIYGEFICTNINALREMAREIDAYYEDA